MVRRAGEVGWRGAPPVPEPGSLVRVFARGQDGGRAGEPDVVSYPDFIDLRRAAAGIDLAAHTQSDVRVGEAAERESRRVELVSGNYFRVLRLTPLAGRLLAESDDRAEGESPVTVLAESLWRARFASDPSVIGRTLSINGHPFEVVGVAPAGFRGTLGAEAADLWTPLTMQRQVRPRGLGLERRGWGFLWMIGRLDGSLPAPAVAARLEAAAVEIARREGGDGSGAFAVGMAPARRLSEPERRASAPFLGLTFAFTLLLLVVTCANLAGLLQARLLARLREVAIRQSLGAGRGRLVVQWLSESLVLALLGGGLGLAAARWTANALAGVEPPGQLLGNLALQVPFDARVVGFTFAVSILSALAFGLLPALRAGGPQPLAILKEDAGTTSGGRRGARVRRVAVAVQVAASVVLLVVSGLLVRSLRNREAFDPGFPTANLALLQLDFRRGEVPEPEARALLAEAMARVRALPGVVEASTALVVPLDLSREQLGFRVPGYRPPASAGESGGSDAMSLDYDLVDARYFATMGIPLVRGRSWEASLTAADGPVAVVNQTAARRFWGDADPLGKEMELIGKGMVRVVGVARDISYYQVGEAPRPYVYLPSEIGFDPTPILQVRTREAVERLLPVLDRTLAEVDPRVAPVELYSFERMRSAPLFAPRALAATAAAFGLVALLLTAVGLYGVVAESVAQRRREIGLRMALGARAGDVAGGILREAAWLAGAGLAAGFLAAYLGAGALRSFLFGVSAGDGLIYGAVAALLAAITLIAAWLPARSAAAVDPAVALRG